MYYGSNRKNHNEAISWLVSYIFILLIPIIFSCFIYFQFINTLSGNIMRANQSLLAGIQKIVDVPFRDMERISEEISFNDKVNLMINSDQSLLSRQALSYDMKLLSKELELYKLGSDYFEDIYICYRGSGACIGTSAYVTLDMFYDAYVKPNGTTIEQWGGFLSDAESRTFLPISEKNSSNIGNRFILFKVPLCYPYITQLKADMIFIVNESTLLRSMQNKRHTLKYDINLIDDNNKTIISTNYEKDYSYIDYKSLAYQNRYNKDKYVVLQASSSVYDWKYLMIVSSSDFWEKLRYVKQLMLMGIILCLLVGGVVSVQFVKKNHTAISNLVNIIAHKAGISLDTNYSSLQFLKQITSKAIAENEKMIDWTERQGNNLRNSFLVRLLKGNVEGALPVDEYLNTYNMVFATENFGVLLFYIEDYVGFSSNDNKKDSIDEYELVQFLIINIVEELVNQKNYGYMCPVDQMIGCIVSFNEDDDQKNYEELNMIAIDAQQLIKEHFDIRLSIAISSVNKTIRGIAVGYLEAMEAMEYKAVVGTEKILHYSDIKKNVSYKTNEYYYPLQLEDKLINCVKAADIESAKEIAYEIFEKNISENSISMQMTKCLLFNMIGTMIKVINELSDLYGNDFADKIDPIHRLINCDNIDKMKLDVIHILEESCSYIGKRKKDDGNMLQSKIEEYIKNNYKDEELSILKIGEYVDMSPAYVSKLFKEQSCIGLLDYLGKVRIKEAKRLMKEAGYTIMEAANEVGYHNRKTFERTFKKFEGITPKKFIEFN